MKKFYVFVLNTDPEILPTKSYHFSVEKNGTLKESLDDTDKEGNPLTYTIYEYAENGLSRLNIQYYIGENQTVDGVSIACYRGNERNYYFDILVSADGENWEEVLPDIVTPGDTSDLIRYDLPEAKRQVM